MMFETSQWHGRFEALELRPPRAPESSSFGLGFRVSGLGFRV